MLTEDFVFRCGHCSFLVASRLVYLPDQIFFAAIASFARRKMKIETILTPAELPALAQRDLRATACVVFDVPAKLR